MELQQAWQELARVRAWQRASMEGARQPLSLERQPVWGALSSSWQEAAVPLAHRLHLQRKPPQLQQSLWFAQTRKPHKAGCRRSGIRNPHKQDVSSPFLDTIPTPNRHRQQVDFIINFGTG